MGTAIALVGPWAQDLVLGACLVSNNAFYRLHGGGTVFKTLCIDVSTAPVRYWYRGETLRRVPRPRAPIPPLPGP